MKIRIFGGKRRDIFDWREIPAVDPDELALWMGATDAVNRQFPLQIALQVHDELERRMMAEGKMDALQLSEIRGGLKALARFAQIYSAAITPKRKKQ
jgi:hypothetical protein